MNAHPIRPSAITCTRCGGQAADPATEAHAVHRGDCDSPADASAAMDAARDVEAALTWEMALTASTRGIRAVAEAAFIPGGPSVSELETRYAELEAATRAKAHAA